MITYDPRGMTWDQYCKLMAELFAPNQLGYVEEENWRQWVDGLNGIGYFVQSGVPDHRGFDHWYQWAEQMVGIMSVGAQ
ncbi:MAG: hypothetical protein EBS66_15480 [Betaproteobacteria bacterium]|nr:hypothetical protein [Betaproteobacteria bacterium]